MFGDEIWIEARDDGRDIGEGVDGSFWLGGGGNDWEGFVWGVMGG